MNLVDIQKLIKNINIKALGIRAHGKASERYIDVAFSYPLTGGKWEGSIPFEYRRLGLDIKVPVEIVDLLTTAYDNLSPEKRNVWRQEQLLKWTTQNSGKKVTKEFFDKLCNLNWNCVTCDLPQNPNWARRVQDIKEMGYLLSTNTSKFCQKCSENSTHIMLIPFEVGSQTGYEVISPELTKRIIKSLNGKNIYEDRVRLPSFLIPDHKFPEIRWDQGTKVENLSTMTAEEIRSKFQLLDNQRNQQKREVCRGYRQTGKRGVVFGITFFYEGKEFWPENIPLIGKEAEAGCVGCGWYDLEKWRNSLNTKLKES